MKSVIKITFIFLVTFGLLCGTTAFAETSQQTVNIQLTETQINQVSQGNLTITLTPIQQFKIKKAYNVSPIAIKIDPKKLSKTGNYRIEGYNKLH